MELLNKIETDFNKTCDNLLNKLNEYKEYFGLFFELGDTDNNYHDFLILLSPVLTHSQYIQLNSVESLYFNFKNLTRFEYNHNMKGVKVLKNCIKFVESDISNYKNLDDCLNDYKRAIQGVKNNFGINTPSEDKKPKKHALFNPITGLIIITLIITLIIIFN